MMPAMLCDLAIVHPASLSRPVVPPSLNDRGNRLAVF
jgi:hypothetical protein